MKIATGIVAAVSLRVLAIAPLALWQVAPIEAFDGCYRGSGIKRITCGDYINVPVCQCQFNSSGYTACDDGDCFDPYCGVDGLIFVCS